MVIDWSKVKRGDKLLWIKDKTNKNYSFYFIKYYPETGNVYVDYAYRSHPPHRGPFPADRFKLPRKKLFEEKCL